MLRQQNLQFAPWLTGKEFTSAKPEPLQGHNNGRIIYYDSSLMSHIT